ncbi:hypothetical protein MBLNU459_g6919t1 [Dothideomycetes sp. NU459]
MSSQQDPHQGGDLSSMAATGTSIPGDAGVQNLIPSVPRPDQGTSSADLGAADRASAASNATDMPRRTQDIGASGEVVTGTGDQLPAQVESKRLHFGANDAQAKGHDRDDKHRAQNESDLERYQGDGAEADPAPGEEEDTQDQIRDRKGI